MGLIWSNPNNSILCIIPTLEFVCLAWVSPTWEEVLVCFMLSHLRSCVLFVMGVYHTQSYHERHYLSYPTCLDITLWCFFIPLWVALLIPPWEALLIPHLEKLSLSHLWSCRVDPTLRGYLDPTLRGYFDPTLRACVLWILHDPSPRCSDHEC